MRRSFIAWGIVVATLLAIAGATVLVLNVSTYSAHATVQRYLLALSEGRTVDAARTAGVNPESVIPVAAESDHRITNIVVLDGVAAGGAVTVEARATVLGETVTFTPVLVPAPALGGIFTQWTFAEAPVASATVDASPVNSAVINGAVADTAGTVSVLVPGVMSVTSASSWFTATEQVTGVSAHATPHIALDLRPSDVFRDTVNQHITEYVDDCARQHVMFPVQCPFGATTDNPIHDGPRWIIVEYPQLQFSRTASDRSAGSWTVRGTGVVDLEATLVDIATGTLFPVDTRQRFAITAAVTGLDTDSPQITVRNPAN